MRQEMMDKSDIFSSKLDMATLAPGYVPPEMFKPEPLPPLAQEVVKLEQRCAALSELCGQMLASLQLPGNAHLFDGFPEGWFDLVEIWDTTYSRLVKAEALDELMPQTPISEERRVLELVPPLLKQIRGFANDAFGGPSSLTDCIDLVLEETKGVLHNGD